MQNTKIITNSDRIIRYLYYLLFLLTPLLMMPFTSELFEFNKMILIYLITVFILIFWLFKMIIAKKIIIKKTVFDIPIFLFILSQLLSTLFSIDRHTSIYGYYGRFNGGLISIFSYVLLYYGFVSNLVSLQETSRRVVSTILKISLISSTFVILWGLPGKLGHDLSCLLFLGQFNNSCWTDQFRPAERMFSTLGQPNWLGAYLAINFFIGIYFFLKNVFENKKFTLGYFTLSTYLLLNFIANLFTRSRSSLFAVVLGIGLVFLFGFIRIRKTISKREMNLISIILLGFFISVLIFKTGIEKIDKFLSISYYYNSLKRTWQVNNGLAQRAEDVQNTQIPTGSDVTTSGDIRKIVWQGALNLGLKYPLFGTGVETFAYSYYFVRPKEHNLTSEWDYLYNKAHNEYLNYLATTGFFGLGAYLILIFSILIYAWKNIKNQKSTVKNNNEPMKQWSNQILILSLFISYVTILITNFFGFSTTTINLFFYLIPAFLVTINPEPEQARFRANNQQLSSSRLSLTQIILSLFLLSSTFYLLSSLVKYYFADIKYAKADNLTKLGEYQKAAQNLNDAYNLHYEHVYEDKLSYVLANIAFIASYQEQSEIAKNMRQTADELNLKSLKVSARNVLYWKTRAKNYYLFYQITSDKQDLGQGIKALQLAKQYSPTDPKIPYSLAVYYSLLEDENKEDKEKLKYKQLALFEVEQAINLKSNFRDAYFLKGTLLKKDKKFDQAKTAFEYILDYINPDDEEAKAELDSL